MCAFDLGAASLFCACFAPASGANDVQVDVAHVLQVHACESGTVAEGVGDAVDDGDEAHVWSWSCW